MLTQNHRQFYDNNGYVLVRGLFSADDVKMYREHYMTLRRRGACVGDMEGIDAQSQDPLKLYPRLIHMHRWDEITRFWLLEERLKNCLTGLLDDEPYAVQSMLYFKPPGARGQALHQDNFYLKAQPGNCIAAWMALDECDEANGCMQVVPESHNWPLLCAEKADTKISFTDVTVPLPPNQKVDPILMQPGDVLFFNGSVVHGSYPNTTSDRFRRALIGHYVTGDAKQVGQFYHPALRMDGTPVELEANDDGSPCGLWVEREGALVAELSGVETVNRKHE